MQSIPSRPKLNDSNELQ